MPGVTAEETVKSAELVLQVAIAFRFIKLDMPTKVTAKQRITLKCSTRHKPHVERKRTESGNGRVFVPGLTGEREK